MNKASMNQAIRSFRVLDLFGLSSLRASARRSKWPEWIVGILVFNAPLARAGITPVNSDFLNDTVDRTSYTKSFDASGGGNPVNRLIVSVGTESKPPITAVNSGTSGDSAPGTTVTATASEAVDGLFLGAAVYHNPSP